jgi:hypothetical protein
MAKSPDETAIGTSSSLRAGGKDVSKMTEERGGRRWGLSKRQAAET